MILVQDGKYFYLKFTPLSMDIFFQEDGMTMG